MIAPRPSPPRPSPLLRFLRRLAITAGIGAAIALVIRLYELYLKPRLMLLPREITESLAKRIHADILDEIDLTRSLAAKMQSGAFSM